VDRVSVSEDSRLWTVEDFARWAGIPIASVYYQASRGRIPGVVRLGKTLRIDPEIAVPALRRGVSALNIAAARDYLRDAVGEVEITNEDVLDAAAIVVVQGKAAL
jgi:hypothetical protein